MRIVVLTLLLSTAAACQGITLPGSFADEPDVKLLSGEWQLVSTSGTLLQQPSKVTFVVGFSADGHVGGKAGPNFYGGLYSASEAGEISMWDLVGTQIGGPEAERGAEILTRMAASERYEASRTALRLYQAGGGHLSFRRVDGTDG